HGSVIYNFCESNGIDLQPHGNPWGDTHQWYSLPQEEVEIFLPDECDEERFSSMVEVAEATGCKVAICLDSGSVEFHVLV
ncbi:hypothetical protein, partial [Klebsiella pneumoniae]|uniref:hypothetical protein n=1 Tax=Klebsiella pneumoniae TaxID=573 RepID=UPI00272F64C0